MAALDGEMFQAFARPSDEQQGVKVDFGHVGELYPGEPLSSFLKESFQKEGAAALNQYNLIQSSADLSCDS